MATRTISNAGGNWSATTAWVEGAVPTAADEVVATGTSGNLTIDAAAVARSINLAGYTGVLTHAAAVTLTLGDATAATGNVLLNFPAGMTYTLGNVATSAITVVSTSATLQTLAFGGKAGGNLTFNPASGGNYAIISALAMDATASLTSTGGDLRLDGTTDNAGLAHAIGKFVASSSTVRTIRPGTATITATGTATWWNMSNSLNLTYLGGSETIINASGGTSTITFASGNKSYGTLRLTSTVESSITTSSGGVATFVNLERSGTPPATSNNLSMSLPAAGTAKVTGTLTVAGPSAALRAIVWTSSNAIPATLDVTGATLVLSNVNFQDITFKTGGTNVNLAAITGGSGDAGGNTITGGGTLTFTAAATQTWQTTGAGNWSDPTKWTSRIPLPQDPVVISSAFVGSPTITVDMPWCCASLDASASTGTLTINSALANGGNIGGGGAPTGPIFKGRAGLTLTNSAACTFYFNSRRATDTFTSGGATINAACQFSTANGGNLSFTDNAVFGGAVQHRSGTLTAPAGVQVGFNTYLSNATSASAPVVLAGGGRFNLIGSGTVFSIANSVAFTQVTVAELGVTNTTASSKTFAGAGGSYPRLVITGGGTGAVIITGANTFADLPQVVGGTKTITLPSGTTTTFSHGESFGNGTNVVTLQSSTAGTPATVTVATGAIEADYLALKDIAVTAPTKLYAGTHSTDNTGNTGVSFVAAPRTGFVFA